MTYYQVRELWRYPVKSLGGQSLQSATVLPRGFDGDRAFALLDTTRNKIVSASRFPDMLLWNSSFDANGDLQLRDPQDSPQSTEQLCQTFGPDLSLVSSSPTGGHLFDYAGIHILSAATLRALAEAYPEGNFAIERFRPNIVVDSERATPFAENNWVGREIAIGPEVRIRVIIACPRCVMATLPHRTLPLDPKILTTAAARNSLYLEELQSNQPCVGAYAEVVRGGTIRLDHSMHVL